MKSSFPYRPSFLLVALLVTCFVFGQRRLLEPELYVGIHGGVLASTVTFQPVIPNTSMHFSGNGGFVFRYSNQKCCGVQVELNYMQRGWHENISSSYSVNGSSGIYFRRLDYLELPLLMHLYFGNSSWRGIVNAGPQIGYCLHDLSSGPQSRNPTAQYDSLQYPFDWGIAAGLGFYYRNSKAGVFEFEARFNYSLSDIFAHSKESYFSQSHAMNISANIGWYWEIKNQKKRRL